MLKYRLSFVNGLVVVITLSGRIRYNPAVLCLCWLGADDSGTRLGEATSNFSITIDRLTRDTDNLLIELTKAEVEEIRQSTKHTENSTQRCAEAENTTPRADCRPISGVDKK